MYRFAARTAKTAEKNTFREDGKIGERESIRADEEEYAMLFSKERTMSYGKVSQVKIYIRSKGLLDWCIPGSWYLKNVSRWLETLPL